MKRSPKKSAKSFPVCACGCGQRTKGGTFRMGHDQRLRGILKRGEAINAMVRSFVQTERGEWAKLFKQGRAAPSTKARRKAQKAVQREAKPKRKYVRKVKPTTAPEQQPQA